MTARDELVDVMRSDLWSHMATSTHSHVTEVSESLLAAGWRKMPNKDEIARALAISNGWPADEWEQIIKEPISRTLTYWATADAILALMDGDNE